MANHKKNAIPSETQLDGLLPNKSELRQYIKYRDKTEEELDKIAEDYVKLAFVLLDIAKHKALDGNKKNKLNF